MVKRKVLFSPPIPSDQKCSHRQPEDSVIRVFVELPGHILNPPKFVQFRGKLYEYRGSGMGGDITTNFYHEVVDFMMLETDKDYTRQEFPALTPA